MSSRGPADDEARTEWRRARRRIALEHHPDRGGDAEQLQRRLDAVDAAFATEAAGGGGASGGTAPETRVAGGVGRLLHRAGRQIREVERAIRSRIPLRWPGARRYIDL